MPSAGATSAPRAPSAGGPAPSYRQHRPDHQHGEGHGAEHAELRDQEARSRAGVQQVEEGPGVGCGRRGLAQLRVMGCVGHRLKAVQRVPDQVRRQHRQREACGQRQLRRPPPPAHRGRHRRMQAEPERQVDDGVFRQAPEPQRQPQPRRPSEPRPRAIAGQPPRIAPHRERRTGHHQAVCGDHRGGELHARRQAVDRRRPEPGPPAVQTPPRPLERDGGDGVRQRRGQAHEGFPIPEGGGRRDDPGDHRRLGEVAERQMARPHPVLSLLWVELDGAEEEAGHAHGCEQAQKGQSPSPGRLRRLRVLAWGRPLNRRHSSTPPRRGALAAGGGARQAAA